MVYNGQKLTKLVNAKTAATTKPTIPIVPMMVPEKYNPIKTAANNNRMTLSALPMFFFMIFLLVGKKTIDLLLK